MIHGRHNVDVCVCEILLNFAAESIPLDPWILSSCIHSHKQFDLHAVATVSITITLHPSYDRLRYGDGAEEFVFVCVRVLPDSGFAIVGISLVTSSAKIRREFCATCTCYDRLTDRRVHVCIRVNVQWDRRGKNDDVPSESVTTMMKVLRLHTAPHVQSAMGFTGRTHDTATVATTSNC